MNKNYVSVTGVEQMYSFCFTTYTYYVHTGVVVSATTLHVNVFT